MIRAVRPVGALAVALVLATACGQEPGDQDPYREVACPADVAAVIVAEATCGYLSVPENRDTRGRTIRLFVVRIASPGQPLPEPILVVGRDLGHQLAYPGIVPLAQRTGREVILLDQRGTGRSEPVLDCPELTELATTALAAATDDPAPQAAYLDAVAACHRRLTETGVDVSAYHVAAMAADAEELRQALRIESWNLQSNGTASRIVFEMLRQWPERVRAVVLDSPELPDLDPRVSAAGNTQEALAAVAASCQDDPECRERQPDLVSQLDQALRRLERQPITLEVAEGTSVHFDAALLVRLLRQMAAAPAGGEVEAIPEVVDAAVAGRSADLTQLVTDFLLTGDLPYCNGYFPDCRDQYRQVPGVVLTTLCHDIAPFTDANELRRLPGDLPGYAAAYGRSPLLAVCDRWRVGEASSSVAEPVRTQVPTFVAVGALNPYVRPDQLRLGLSGVSDLVFAVDPAGGHNIIGRTDCMLGIRNAWLENPFPSIDDRCLRSLRVDWQSSGD